MNTVSLTFTRFVAALLVFVFHFGKDLSFLKSPYISNFINKGNIAVSYFFFLSGFVLTIAYFNRFKHNQIFNFWFKRAVRIYPLYFLALISYCLLCIIFDYSYVGVKDFFLHLFLFQAWNEGTAITLNYPGWSLSVEAFFYFSFPLIFSYLLKLKSRYLIIVTLLLWSISQYISYICQINFNPIIHFNTFLFGITTGIILLRESEFTFIKNHGAIIFLLGLVLFISLLIFPNFTGNHYHNGLFSPIYVFIIGGLVYSNNIISYLFSLKIAVVLGEISYGFYIFQYPSLIIAKYIKDKLNLALFESDLHLFSLHFTVLLIMSFLSFYIVENPMKKLVNKNKQL